MTSKPPRESLLQYEAPTEVTSENAK